MTRLKKFKMQLVAHTKLPEKSIHLHYGRFKRMHGVMTDGLVPECGKFRSGEEGVFDGDRCIFMAPTAKLVTDR